MDTTKKLQAIWLDKLQKEERISIKDLYQFSHIKLKKKRFRKKFDKNYGKYVSEEVYKAFWGILIAQLASIGTSSQLGFPIVEPVEELPKGELFYLDYKYKEEKQ